MRTQGPAGATAMLRHPSSADLPERASHARTNSSIGRAILFLPEQVIDPVLNDSAGAARREAGAERDDRNRKVLDPGHARIKRVEQQDAPLPRPRHPFGPIAAHSPDRWTAWN